MRGGNKDMGPVDLSVIHSQCSGIAIYGQTVLGYHAERHEKGLR